MEKPILATNIDGLLIEHKAFVEPHKDWFERAIKKTKDNSLRKWIGADPYWPGVDEAMEKILPNASKEERTKTAREWYQEDVIKYIKYHSEVVKKDIAEKLLSIKDKYRLILLTTNTKDYIYQILKVSKLEKIYDNIIASDTEKEPKKEELLNRLIKKYGKPKYYLTGKLEDSINNSFKKLDIKVISEKEINQI
jgi:phosphoglycolate phosphatase-like HAD superfamily hydrolase